MNLEYTTGKPAATLDLLAILRCTDDIPVFFKSEQARPSWSIPEADLADVRRRLYEVGSSQRKLAKELAPHYGKSVQTIIVRLREL